MNKLLLIDDDKITQMLCKITVQRVNSDIEVVSVSNGKEALDLLNPCLDRLAAWPDLILLDLNMPIFNGWDFLNELTSNKSKLADLPPIVILTSTINPNDKEKAVSYKCVKGFITKPLNKEHVITLLDLKFNWEEDS